MKQHSQPFYAHDVACLQVKYDIQRFNQIDFPLRLFSAEGNNEKYFPTESFTSNFAVTLDESIGWCCGDVPSIYLVISSNFLFKKIIKKIEPTTLIYF